MPFFLSFQSIRLMATSALCRRGPRLCSLPVLRKVSAKAQHVHVKRVDESDDQEDKKGAAQYKGTPVHGRYRLYYNPRSYHSVCNSAVSQSQRDTDEDECLSTLVPSFWQQSNHYSVSCSRNLSSSKNTLLDLAFNQGSQDEMSSVLLNVKKPVHPDVKVDTRAFLKCRPEYASMTVDLSQQPNQVEWEEAVSVLQKVTFLKGSMKPSDATRFLVTLSHLHPDKMSLVRSDQRFIMLLRYSVELLRLLTPHQLLEVLRSFMWLDIPPTHTILGLFEAEMCSRAGQMSLDQLLLAADLWRCIGRKVPQFLEHLYRSVHLHIKQIGVPELVHLLYIMGEGRKCPTDLIHPVERLLMRNVHKLYPEEVGTVCLGLFKSQTSISECAVTHIVDKAHSFVDEMSDLAIVNVMKVLRFGHQYHSLWLEAMVQEVPRRAHRMGVTGLMHMALTCSALHFRNDTILLAIAEKVPALVPHCRTKDSCKLLWAFGTLGFLPSQSPSLYPSLTESLRQRKADFQQYPEHLLTGLLGLVFVSQFPEDLIAFALSPEFVSLAVKSTQLELKKDLFTLDGAVDLELPQWTGPRLSCELRQEVADKLWKFAQSDVCQKPEVQEAESALRDLLGGEQFVCKRMILPHARSIDLEVHFDSSGQPIPVNAASATATASAVESPSKCPPHKGLGKINVGVTITDELLAQLKNVKNTTETSTSPPAKPLLLPTIGPDEGGSLFDKRLVLTSDLANALTGRSSPGPAPKDTNGTLKLAIQVSNRNHYCYHSKQLLGLHVMKRRQLILAGYRVVELGHQEWFPMLRRSRIERLAYLHSKIYSCL